MARFVTREPRNLTMSVTVNGSYRYISFSTPVLYGNVGVSSFTTHDPDLIEALKASPKYGVVFYLDENDEATNSAQVQSAKTIEEELSDPISPIIVESVTNRAMAIAYIQGTYEESFTSTSNEDMRREAARRWNILFPKWTR